jgi:hypothetical protein
MEAYLQALVANDASSLRLAKYLKATENAEPSDFNSGLWKAATRIGSYKLIVIDKESGHHGFVGVIWRGDSEASICSIRIKLNSTDEIEESEILLGPDRFPGDTATDVRTLDTFRPDFDTVIPSEKRHTREELYKIAKSYYDGVNNATPELVPLSHEGNRVEQGTQITNTSKYVFSSFHAKDPNVTLPNFAEWSAKEQFDVGLWSSDRVDGERFPLIDVERGLVFAYAIYKQWAKKDTTELKGFGEVGGSEMGGMKVALCMTEVFKIKEGEIFDMESAWFIGPMDQKSGW